MSVVLSKGGLGPTTVGEGQGIPCAPDTPTCRYLDVELAGVAPGTYSVSCAHDGWANIGPSVFWTFSISVADSGMAESRGPVLLELRPAHRQRRLCHRRRLRHHRHLQLAQIAS